MVTFVLRINLMTILGRTEGGGKEQWGQERQRVATESPERKGGVYTKAVAARWRRDGQMSCEVTTALFTDGMWQASKGGTSGMTAGFCLGQLEKMVCFYPG